MERRTAEICGDIIPLKRQACGELREQHETSGRITGRLEKQIYFNGRRHLGGMKFVEMKGEAA